MRRGADPRATCARARRRQRHPAARARPGGRGTRRIHLFLTHLHLDHLEGLRFFAPLWDPRRDARDLGAPLAGARASATGSCASSRRRSSRSTSATCLLGSSSTTSRRSRGAATGVSSPPASWSIPGRRSASASRPELDPRLRARSRAGARRDRGADARLDLGAASSPRAPTSSSTTRSTARGVRREDRLGALERRRRRRLLPRGRADRLVLFHHDPEHADGALELLEDRAPELTGSAGSAAARARGHGPRAGLAAPAGRQVRGPDRRPAPFADQSTSATPSTPMIRRIACTGSSPTPADSRTCTACPDPGRMSCGRGGGKNPPWRTTVLWGSPRSSATATKPTRATPTTRSSLNGRADRRSRAGGGAAVTPRAVAQAAAKACRSRRCSRAPPRLRAPSASASLRSASRGRPPSRRDPDQARRAASHSRRHCSTKSLRTATSPSDGGQYGIDLHHAPSATPRRRPRGHGAARSRGAVVLPRRPAVARGPVRARPGPRGPACQQRVDRTFARRSKATVPSRFVIS